MKKGLKTALIILVVLAVAGGCVGGYFVWRHHDMYIEKEAALRTALDHAGLKQTEIFHVEVEFEKNRYSAWYEVSFETQGMEYEYVIDAVNGSILNSYSEPEHAGH